MLVLTFFKVVRLNVNNRTKRNRLNVSKITFLRFRASLMIFLTIVDAIIEFKQNLDLKFIFAISFELEN